MHRCVSAGRGSTATDNYYVGPFRGRIDNVKVYNYPAAGITTSVGAGNGETTPYTFDLAQNYPNPFNPTTRIEFVGAEGDGRKLIVYDVLGRAVKTLFNEVTHAG